MVAGQQQLSCASSLPPRLHDAANSHTQQLQEGAPGAVSALAASWQQQQETGGCALKSTAVVVCRWVHAMISGSIDPDEETTSATVAHTDTSKGGWHMKPCRTDCLVH